jgi:DNA-binding winged helix-turn-helix (wHTH) protein
MFSIRKRPDYPDAVPRYRFGDFTLSPRRRILICAGEERPLIPRYFDLLVFLIERRHEAVHRRDIFDRVWNDVIVSDSALSQAIRTIRRTLGDDPREPRFIRTVSRHGYRFVFSDVVEEEDDGMWPSAQAAVEPTTAPQAVADPFEPLLQRVTSVATTADEEEEQREAAELLHALGTAEALRRLDRRPRHANARARCAIRGGIRRIRARCRSSASPLPSRLPPRSSACGCAAPDASSPRAGQGRQSAAGLPVLLPGPSAA